MLHIAGFDIVSVQTGTFRLDGGAMFGVVPKVLWAPHEDVDDENRILLATRTVVAVSGDRKYVILTDTGTGPKWSEEEAVRYAIRPEPDAIARALETHFALSISDVTDVIVTHLHFDHNGGLTEWVNEPGGQTRLRFPKARHWIHDRHWDHVHHPTERDRVSFLARDFEVLGNSSVLNKVEGDEPATPWEGIRFFVSHGHTPGQLLPVFFDDDHELMFTGDVFPTSSHLRVPWVMAFDLEPVKTMLEKRRILGWCRKGGTWLAFPHDVRLGVGEVDFANKRPLIGRILQR